MSLHSLADAFYGELCDIHDAERQSLKALLKMIRKATDRKLVQVLTKHMEASRQQLIRVDAAFVETGRSSKAKRCEAMDGLSFEIQELMDSPADPDVMDAVIIGLVQKLGHFEMASYGTLCAWASSLGYENAKRQLGENLAEKIRAVRALNELSKNVNTATNMVGKLSVGTAGRLWAI
jgi:ferritin-like metal-binding protein YciE